MKVALRLDAGLEIGYGHLVRTAALGRRLAARGVECRVFTRSPVAVRSFQPATALPVAEIPAAVAPEEEGGFLASRRWAPEVVVADLYRPRRSQVDSLRRACPVLVCVDDETDIVFDCDLLVNPSLSPEFAHRLADGTEYLRGAEVVLLRGAFAGSESRRVRETVRQIVVCFGGGDRLDLSAAAARWLLGRLPPAVEEVVLVVGAAYPRLAELRSLAAGRACNVIQGEPDMAARLRRSDVGLLAAGTLAYEAAATGLPSVLVSVNRAQALEAEHLAARGAAIHLPAARFEATELRRSLARLESAEVRRRFSAKAHGLIDGRGVERVAERILRLAAERAVNRPPTKGAST